MPLDFKSLGEPVSQKSVFRRRAILVNSGNRVYESAMPLGLMALATTLHRHHGISCEILDLPRESPDTLETQISQYWRRLNLSDVLFVGFGTLCNTMPRTLSLARALRAEAPEIKIIFGGPEASARASLWMRSYPFIDGLVVGEAEGVLGALVEALETGTGQHRPGLLFRDSFDKNLPVLGDWTKAELAPLVDLNLTEPTDYSTYAAGPKSRSVQLEVGRGCPYGCTFCSTKEFFRRRFRLKSSARIVADVASIAQKSTLKHFDFVHDMFTTNRKLVVEVCEALILSGLNITWGCSARTDRVDDELLDIMWRAGCRDVYFGLETGSARMQKHLKKNLDLDDAVSKLRLASSMGFGVSASLIIGYPNEETDDLVDTLNLVLRLRSWRPRLESVKVHLLEPLAGTELTTAHRQELLYDGHMSAATSVNYLTEWEETQIRTHPDLFSSFYYCSNPCIERSVYKWLHWVLNTHAEDVQRDWEAYKGNSGVRLLEWARRSGQYPVKGYEMRWAPARSASFLRPCVATMS